MSQSFVSVASSRVREAAETRWREARKEQEYILRCRIEHGRKLYAESRWFWQTARELTDGQAYEYCAIVIFLGQQFVADFIDTENALLAMLFDYPIPERRTKIKSVMAIFGLDKDVCVKQV